jgi:hypothetical protein
MEMYCENCKKETTHTFETKEDSSMSNSEDYSEDCVVIETCTECDRETETM